MYYYAVKNGYIPGIYNTWSECQKQVLGYSKPIYKKFKTITEAQIFINTPCVNNNTTANTTANNRIKVKQKSLTLVELQEIIYEIELTNNIEQINLEQLKDKNGYYYVFTDGSKQQTHTSYGVYLPGCKLSFAELITDETQKTNNIAELYAIKTALEIILRGYLESKISKLKTIYIISDSEYSIKSITEWYKKWERNNWITTTGKPVANSNIIKSIIKLIKIIREEQNVKIVINHQYAHKSLPTCSKLSIEYYLWQGNYIIDYLVQKAVINQ